MVDWPRHYDAIYARIGVDAVLTIPGTDGGEFALRVVDKTSGIVVGGGGVEVGTVLPACDVRAVQFFGLSLNLDDMKGSEIAFNGVAWDIERHEMRPSPAGESAGEIRLFLSAQ